MTGGASSARQTLPDRSDLSPSAVNHAACHAAATSALSATGSTGRTVTAFALCCREPRSPSGEPPGSPEPPPLVRGSAPPLSDRTVPTSQRITVRGQAQPWASEPCRTRERSVPNGPLPRTGRFAGGSQTPAVGRADVAVTVLRAQAYGLLHVPAQRPLVELLGRDAHRPHRLPLALQQAVRIIDRRAVEEDERDLAFPDNGLDHVLPRAVREAVLPFDVLLQVRLRLEDHLADGDEQRLNRSVQLSDVAVDRLVLRPGKRHCGVGGSSNVVSRRTIRPFSIVNRSRPRDGRAHADDSHVHAASTTPSAASIRSTVSRMSGGAFSCDCGSIVSFIRDGRSSDVGRADGARARVASGAAAEL